MGIAQVLDLPYVLYTYPGKRAFEATLDEPGRAAEIRTTMTSAIWGLKSVCPRKAGGLQAGGTERDLWDHLVHHHPLGRPKLVGSTSSSW
ncbi:MAG: hypothetical protein ACREXS_00550 [Gammaproteobacteria bacterium]